MKFLLKYFLCCFIIFSVACNTATKKNAPVLFETLTADKTGLNFTNKLTSTNTFNLFHYMYFYNGAGVGAADFNNDGKIDLFFASNQAENKLYLNKGNLQFTDATVAAKIPQDSGWSTGVSVVDINNDGLLDIYVCRVGNYEILQGKNQLLICKGIDTNGVPYYENEAKLYGLDFSGFSTHAAFFDFDLDGDLDMFLLNHSVHQNGTFAPRKEFLGTYHPLSGDRIFKNDGNNHFTDVTKQSNINSSAISYGLGVAIADINVDGYPDIYVGNDFHENDYLYINQKNGTFKEVATEQLMHTSQFSMGVDVADVTNDGFPEIISMDMLPSDPYILKRSLGEDDYDLFNEKISIGYSHQYTRNNLQYNKKNGMFSEVGLYAGVYATDWSWAPLWMDFDNDGLKDLFISNGIPKRMNDMDFVNFVSNKEVQQKIRENKTYEKDVALANKFPEIKIPNKFYSNKNNLNFEDKAENILNDKATFSNGAVYADLDNDGDLDVVVNNIDDPVLIYKNKSNDDSTKPFASLKLVGNASNVNAVGARVVIFSNNNIKTYEKYPVHGFQSSMELPLHIGLVNATIDSAFLIWNDNSYQPITLLPSSKTLEVKWQKGLPKFNYQTITNFYKNNTAKVVDVTTATNLNFVHQENPFQEFNREFLLPHMLSTEGPALAIADINKDGLEDVFIGSAKTYQSAIFVQQANGKFTKTLQPILALDSMYEDVDATWADINNDGNIDLIVASGGNEYFGEDKLLQPRIYLNDGKANFSKLENAFTGMYTTQSCVQVLDFNNDGYVDLFFGGRCVPWEYGKMPQSFLLQNNKAGKFIDVTEQYCKQLTTAGFVTHALAYDVNKDSNKDLILTYEWGGIDAFINNKNGFTQKTITNKKGWWNFVLPVDVNNDGNIDFVAGNLGYNTRLTATEKQPVKLYYNDFDDNGKAEQILTYYLNGKEIPFANKDELQKQMPIIKKNFLYAEDFAKASLTQIFSKNKLNNAVQLQANYFANAVIINNGNFNFSTNELPWQAQLSTYKDAVVVDANGDNLPDIFLAGNYYTNNIQMGRYDADYGTLLINNGKNNFTVQNLNGAIIKGQVRYIKPITIANKKAFVLAKNNDTTKIISFNQLLK